MSYGVRLPGGERWFVKEGTTDGARLSLRRAWAFHRAVQHPVIVPQVHRIAVRSNWAVVMPWHEGEVLYHPTAGGTADRTAPGSAMARFRALPLPLATRAWERVLSAHLAVEAAGYVAVDFYDGALLYDFTGGIMRLVDLDEYRPGPFVLEEDRLPGSRRFMAPEEYERGATIDVRTTVFTLGRAARLLLDAGDDEGAWRGSPARLRVLHRATLADPGQRFASVRRFAAAWHAAGRCRS
ncbi:serine/threonine protein kinase [Streptomyces roseifaciens]